MEKNLSFQTQFSKTCHPKLKAIINKPIAARQKHNQPHPGGGGQATKFMELIVHRGKHFVILLDPKNGCLTPNSSTSPPQQRLVYAIKKSLLLHEVLLTSTQLAWNLRTLSI